MRLLSWVVGWHRFRWQAGPGGVASASGGSASAPRARSELKGLNEAVFKRPLYRLGPEHPGHWQAAPGHRVDAAHHDGGGSAPASARWG